MDAGSVLSQQRVTPEWEWSPEWERILPVLLGR